MGMWCGTAKFEHGQCQHYVKLTCMWKRSSEINMCAMGAMLRASIFPSSLCGPTNCFGWILFLNICSRWCWALRYWWHSFCECAKRRLKTHSLFSWTAGPQHSGNHMFFMWIQRLMQKFNDCSICACHPDAGGLCKHVSTIGISLHSPLVHVSFNWVHHLKKLSTATALFQTRKALLKLLCSQSQAF